MQTYTGSVYAPTYTHTLDRCTHVQTCAHAHIQLHLYLDRDPQTSRPQVLYTRTWSKVEAEPSDLKAQQAPPATAKLPVCTTGFQDLEDFVLHLLPRLGGAMDPKSKRVSLDHATLGQLELVLALIKLCDLMVDFGFFVDDRNAVDADFTKVKTLVAGLFAVLDTLGRKSTAGTREVSREDGLRVDVRVQALELLLRLFNMRANFRLSLVLDAWEQLLDTDKNVQALLSNSNARVASAAGPEEQQRFRSKLFRGRDGVFRGVVKNLFSKTSVCPESADCDTYQPGGFASDYFVKVLLNLFQFGDTRLTSAASCVLVRHMMQRSRVVNDLALVQVLVFPSAVKVNEETTYVIQRITTLKKSLAADVPEAYQEARALLSRMTEYIKVTPINTLEVVQKNQRIMLNRELDEPICDILRLNIERDTSARDGGEIEADPAKNEQRRDLFQACYDFLTHLCAFGHRRAQEKLFPLMGTFSDHMGIQKLNVADTLRAIVRDNAVLCAQVPESFYRHFIYAILTWGRKPRWLSFFEVFLAINGSPAKRNQDIILRLLLEDRDSLIDLDCDYSVEGARLSKSDERAGKKRLDLLLAADHKRKVASLLKYHYVSVDLLAKCCEGKNPANKAKVATLIPLDVMLDNVLYCHLTDGGTVCEELDYDAACYIKQVLTRLYLTFAYGLWQRRL